MMSVQRGTGMDSSFDNVIERAGESANAWSALGAQQATIRPVLAGDGPILQAFVRQLSPMSRYRRFHGGVSELSPELLKRLTTIDRRHEIALIATTSSFGREVGVGEARYSNEDADPNSREFAIVVADAWQGRGLGSKLLQRLISHAQSRNVRRLYGNVLAENASMLGLAREQGFALRHHPRDSHLVRVQRTLSTDSSRFQPLQPSE
jgi:acetyltransferase